jgi:hypothetical protein
MPRQNTKYEISGKNPITMQPSIQYQRTHLPEQIHPTAIGLALTSYNAKKRNLISSLAQYHTADQGTREYCHACRKIPFTQSSMKKGNFSTLLPNKWIPFTRKKVIFHSEAFMVWGK